MYTKMIGVYTGLFYRSLLCIHVCQKEAHERVDVHVCVVAQVCVATE